MRGFNKKGESLLLSLMATDNSSSSSFFDLWRCNKSHSVAGREQPVVAASCTQGHCGLPLCEGSVLKIFSTTSSCPGRQVTSPTFVLRSLSRKPEGGPATALASGAGPEGRDRVSRAPLPLSFPPGSRGSSADLATPVPQPPGSSMSDRLEPGWLRLFPRHVQSLGSPSASCIKVSEQLGCQRDPEVGRWRTHQASQGPPRRPPLTTFHFPSPLGFPNTFKC